MMCRPASRECTEVATALDTAIPQHWTCMRRTSLGVDSWIGMEWRELTRNSQSRRDTSCEGTRAAEQGARGPPKEWCFPREVARAVERGAVDDARRGLHAYREQATFDGCRDEAAKNCVFVSSAMHDKHFAAAAISVCPGRDEMRFVPAERAQAYGPDQAFSGTFASGRGCGSNRDHRDSISLDGQCDVSCMSAGQTGPRGHPVSWNHAASLKVGVSVRE